MLATLIRLLGDFDLAEEARQDAFTTALETWPRTGLPDHPGAWLISTGRHRAIDRLRRQAVFQQKQAVLEAQADLADPVCFDEAHFGDDRLRLIFTCCHPALALEAQVALTLKVVCGLPTAAVARAFLLTEDTLSQRLLRAKKKIREAGIPYQTPAPAELDARIDGVLAVIYLVFNEGYAASSGPEMISADLCREAIHLTRLLDQLLPRRADIAGLLALLLLHDARRPARLTTTGEIVLLPEQDRRLWDAAQIAEGLTLLDRALQVPGRASSYTVQAAIAALHAQAGDGRDTDWPQIAGLYALLLQRQPTPALALAHAIAVGEAQGPAAALALLDAMAVGDGTEGFAHLLAAARARFLAPLGRHEEALAASRQALAGARLEPERQLLAQRLAALEADAGRVPPQSGGK